MKYLKYIIAFFVIIIPSVIMILVYNDKITQDSPKYYKQGVVFYNQGDYSSAYANFLRIKWISPLYPIALYKQAKSAQKAGDYATAVIKYDAFLQKSPTSIFSETATYNLAKCYFYLKEYGKAKEFFLKTRSTDIDSDYYIGLLEKKENKDKAAEYFINYMKSNEDKYKPNDLLAAEELIALNKNLTNDDINLIGKIFYKNEKYSSALEYFSKLPISTCWDYLVLSNHYAGNKVIAKKLIESGLKEYSSKISFDNLCKIYDIYATYMADSKLKNWQQMLKYAKENNCSGVDYIMYKLASMYTGEKAYNLYNEIQQNYPQSIYAAESLWNIFWDTYNKRNYTQAIALAGKHLEMYKNVNSTPRMIFWLAKIQLKLNKTQEAHNNLLKLTSKYTDDYYGLRAEFILDKKFNFWETDIKHRIPEQKEDLAFPITLSEIDIKDLKLINTLFEMGDYEIWMDARFKNDLVESWFEQRKDKRSKSIVLARDAIKNMEIKPPYMSVAYKLAYPRYWVNELNIAGQKLSIDPFLIIALIREESYFNSEAVSSSNAIGLMQLMPATANYMLSKLDENISQIDDLKNPRTNLYIGCNYLKYLKERFNDNALYMVAAYNGGEGSVNKWSKKLDTSDYDEFIENIPFAETRNYVKKVFRSYHIYKKIYI